MREYHYFLTPNIKYPLCWIVLPRMNTTSVKTRITNLLWTHWRHKTLLTLSGSSFDLPCYYLTVKFILSLGQAIQIFLQVPADKILYLSKIKIYNCVAMYWLYWKILRYPSGSLERPYERIALYTSFWAIGICWI